MGGRGPKEVFSREVIDFFRRYLVIEFAEEGYLSEATQDMLLDQQRSSGSRGLEDSEGKDSAAAAEASREAAAAELFRHPEAGRELFAWFMASGCGAECNLPGTVVQKVGVSINQLMPDNTIQKKENMSCRSINALFARRKTS